MPVTLKATPAAAQVDKFAPLKAKAAAKQADPLTLKPKRYGHARPKVPAIPIEMNGYYGTGEVLAITGWSPAKLFGKLQNKTFPQPFKSGNRNVWKTAVLREHLGL